MRLFTSLWFTVRPHKPKIRHPEGFKGPRGHIYRGKYRIVKKVTNEGVENLKEHIRIEEENMLYLRHPFLTTLQSKGHEKELNKPHNLYIKGLEEREDKFSAKRNKSIIDQLKFLRINEDWDRIPS